MTVLCCGDRHWRDADAVYRVLSLLPNDTVILHGDCEGADTICGDVAQSLGFTVIEHPARWEQFGRSAGPRRNSEMLARHAVDIVFAFHDHLDRSRGTKDMVDKARAKRIPVRVFASGPAE